MKSWGTVSATNFCGETITSFEGYRRSLDCVSPEKMDFQTQFDLASLTKIIFTTNMLMLSVDRGLMSVDDRVQKYLPSWKVSDKEKITVRDLLEHQSGLQPWSPLYVSSNLPKDAYNRIAYSQLVCAPRERRIYSDLGFIVLGEILLKIYASNLENIFEKELKSLFNLQSTQFSSPLRKQNIAATSIGDSYEMNMISSQIPYRVPEKVEDFHHWRSHILDGEINDGNAFHLFNGVSSHAGLFSDAADLINLTRTYLETLEGNGVFKAETLQAFLEISSDPMQCMGFRTWSIPMKDTVVRIYGHTGFTGVAFGFSPKLNFSAVMLSNRLHTNGDFVKTEDIWVPFLENSISEIG